MDTELFRKLILNLSITLAVSALLILLLILVGKDMSGRVANIQNQRNQLAIKTTAADSLISLKKDFQKAELYLNALEKILPTQEEISKNFSKYIESTARKNNAQAQFSLGEAITGGEQKPGFMTFNLKINSTYSNLINFLKTAEAGIYIIEWQSIIASKNPGSPVYTTPILGHVFYR